MKSKVGPIPQIFYSGFIYRTCWLDFRGKCLLCKAALNLCTRTILKFNRQEMHKVEHSFDIFHGIAEP